VGRIALNSRERRIPKSAESQRALNPKERQLPKSVK
jgi:hypothetical protein